MVRSLVLLEPRVRMEHLVQVELAEPLAQVELVEQVELRAQVVKMVLYLVQAEQAVQVEVLE